MQNKIITFLLVFFLSIIGIKAQVNTSSPYSRFGIGEIENSSLGRTKGMGGISSGIRLPFEINTYNPASYTAVPSKVFLFQVGIKSKRTDFITNTNSITNYDFGLASINAALKVNKYWGMSFGLMPVSSIGYKIETTDSVTLNDYTSKYENTYVGEGGISQLYFGNAFAYKGLSIGINAAYYFGALSKNTTSLMNEIGYISYLVDNEDVKIKDLHLRYGLQYNDSIFNKYNLTIGGFFENKTDLNADVLRYTNRTITVGGEATISDTIINDTINSGNVGMPMSYGFGFSIMSKQFIIGADYETSNWKDVLMFGQAQNTLANSSKLSFGIEFTQDYTSKKYLKTINYRLGGYIGNSNVILNNTQIADKGVNFGLGIPTKNGTKINIAFGIGQKGTIENNLIKENYYTINLNFNLVDRWFVRRKFF